MSTPRPTPRPPRLGEALLRLLLPPGVGRDALLGDLEEEFRRGVSSDPRGARRRWWRRAVDVGTRLALHRLTSTEPIMFNSLRDDLRHALRSLSRARGFALLVGVTLAVGIGAATAVFSVVDGVLLRPLPYPDADRLVVPRYGFEGRTIRNHSEPEFFDYRERIRSFEAVAAYRRRTPVVGEGTEAQRIPAIAGTFELLPLLGVQPALGRHFGPDDDRPATAASVVILSHDLWSSTFAADPDIVGRTIRLEGEARTVVGVMPRGFAFPDPSIRAWMPLGLDPADPWGRNNHYLAVVARLAPGVDLDEARAELDELAEDGREAWPDVYPADVRFPLSELRAEVVGSVDRPLKAVFGAVVLVLLASAVNAAGLFLGRGERRRGEVAVRTALGAGRGRVAGQLILESLIVSGVAAVAGTALARLGVAGLQRFAPPGLPRLEAVAVDGRVLGFGVGVALVTGLLFGTAPALQAFASDVRGALGGGGRGGVGRRGAARGRRALVVVQLALATTLVIGSGLLVRSFQGLRQVDLGFEPRGVLAVEVTPPDAVVADDEDAATYYRELEARVAAIPGVEVVGAGLRLALAEGEDNYSIQVEGRLAATPADAPVAGMQYATPGYREAMGLALERGRWFTEADRGDAPLVAVVNRRMADELWPGVDDPVGERLRMFPEGNPWMEVVGVVDDVTYLGVRVPPPAKLYIPHRQSFRSAYYSPNWMTLLVRTATDPAALAGPVRRAVAEVRAGVPVGRVRTVESVVGEALGGDRFVVVLLTGFAAVALLLAAVSIYGVVARSVAERVREIGVRMALGADRSVVARAIVLEGLALGGAGCVVGATAAWLLAGAATPLLYEVSSHDLRVWAGVVPVLGVTTALACAVPAWRASRLDPVDALRG